MNFRDLYFTGGGLVTNSPSYYLTQKVPPLFFFFFFKDTVLAEGSWNNSWQSAFLLGKIKREFNCVHVNLMHKPTINARIYF